MYQDGSRAFATLHEVKWQPNEAPYLCAGQSVTTGFLETLAKGLGASMAAEVLPENVLARTPELMAWWSRARGTGGREKPRMVRGEGILTSAPPGPETKNVSRVVGFSIDVSGASSV